MPFSVLRYTANVQYLRDMNVEELHTPEQYLYAADTDYAIINGGALEKEAKKLAREPAWKEVDRE